jgi:hypothetical protein
VKSKRERWDERGAMFGTQDSTLNFCKRNLLETAYLEDFGDHRLIFIQILVNQGIKLHSISGSYPFGIRDVETEGSATTKLINIAGIIIITNTILGHIDSPVFYSL